MHKNNILTNYYLTDFFQQKGRRIIELTKKLTRKVKVIVKHKKDEKGKMTL